MITLFNQLFPAVPAHKSLPEYYQQTIDTLQVPGFACFYGVHLAIWQLRSQDLQRLYPLTSLPGRIGFLAWCVVHGRREYQALRELTPFWHELAHPADIPATRYSPAITRLMVLALMARPDLRISPQLATEHEQILLLQWYCLHGWRELNITEHDLGDDQRRFFEYQLPNGFTRLETFIFVVYPGLRRQYSLETAVGRQAYRAWLQELTQQESILNLLSRQLNDAAITQTNTSQFSFGVNLIGYAFGELGIGEDVRMAALALQAANIPFTVINFQPGDDIRQNDRSIEQWVNNEPIYAINIVCLTALEHLRLYIEWGGDLFKHRYTIGYWPWELQNWPANWQHCFSLVDEVWASSRHTWQAVERSSPVPVLMMPMAVALPDVKRYRRQQWQLPLSDYLFVFSFDGNSTLARKNPQAVVEAFQQAFPGGDEPVGLVIKCMRPDMKSWVWQGILALAERDRRIHIVDRMLSKSEVLGLYRLCDCFVSLHRAEGFGRGIAEALLLGLHVITTDHGGNVDFCVPGFADLVAYSLVPVGVDDYVEPDGQFWAEVDINVAAHIMKRVVSENRKRNKSVSAKIRQRFATDVVGTAYQHRLSQIRPRF